MLYTTGRGEKLRKSALLFAFAIAAAAADSRALLDKHCVGCHNQKLNTGGLALDSVEPAKPLANVQIWEKVVARLRAGPGAKDSETQLGSRAGL